MAGQERGSQRELRVNPGPVNKTYLPFRLPEPAFHAFKPVQCPPWEMAPVYLSLLQKLDASIL